MEGEGHRPHTPEEHVRIRHRRRDQDREFIDAGADAGSGGELHLSDEQLAEVQRQNVERDRDRSLSPEALRASPEVRHAEQIVEHTFAVNEAGGPELEQLPTHLEREFSVEQAPALIESAKQDGQNVLLSLAQFRKERHDDHYSHEVFREAESIFNELLQWKIHAEEMAEEGDDARVIKATQTILDRRDQLQELAKQHVLRSSRSA